MKPKSLITAVAVLAVATLANAQVIQLTFDADLDNFAGDAIWSATGPAGWTDGGTLQANPTAGGWTMGSGGGPFREFNIGGEEGLLQAIANAGTGIISFDVMVDGSSFPPATAMWYQIQTAGNSDGAAGWTQMEVTDPSSPWQNADQSDLRVWHFEKTFAEMGWDPGDTWFQLFLGGNSDAANPLKFYVDNIVIVPEPSTFALVGLGLGLFWLIRRRK